ncbi:Glucosyltransferase-like protein [Steccherinum ochraceum]|uniref:Alpha-1,3-glucosyltransferase n=1 Tax=Steccherinum ochraceum TaxID=92696 RepID=A0A4R0RVV9_9APHY|nr:Glucosyltransferase-like protein [Steccherinum ochraceum]
MQAANQNGVPFLSQTSNLPPLRVRTPNLRHRTSSQASISSETSEIISPIPRRHHYLQANESRHWLPSPSVSPVSTRAASPPSAHPTTSPRAYRLPQRARLSSVLEQDGHQPLSFPYASQPHTRARPPDEDKHEGSMSRRWVRWMHKQGMKQWVLPSVILISTWVKWCIGLGSYSGHNTPLMYGDYEAQRHWMELTIHLPLHQWYTYDLEYWGLDYPPLTAYHSWLCGVVGSWLDSSWFALDKSRGIETYSSKLYMRSTVLFSDAVIYVLAVVMFTRVWQGSRSTRTQHVALLSLLLQPALLLIDFGHFQYNSVMLGFTLLAMNFFASGHDVWGAVCFSLSLGFKQMSLYYAPAIGSYLLAKCLYLGPVAGRQLFIRLALVTIATFTLIFLPFLLPLASPTAIIQPINRIFPFARGLFEDKVANFWCASNVIFKWKVWFSREALVKLSAGLTALGFLPGVVGLLYSGYTHRLTAQGDHVKPSDVKTAVSAPPPFLPLLPYALLTSSMSFFLFSFQVHEKTILVPLLPLTLLLSGSANDSETFELAALVNNVAVFSMWPLLKRDGLGTQSLAMLLIWNRLIGYNPIRRTRSLLSYLAMVVYTACITLLILEFFVPPPARLPDIFPVLNVLVSTPVFALTWLWSIKRGIEVSWAAGGLGSSSTHTVQAPGLKPQLSTDSTSTTASFTTSRRFSTIETGKSKEWQWSDGQRSAIGEGSSGVTGMGVGAGVGEVGRPTDKLLKRRSLGFKQGASILRTTSVGSTS